MVAYHGWSHAAHQFALVRPFRSKNRGSVLRSPLSQWRSKTTAPTTTAAHMLVMVVPVAAHTTGAAHGSTFGSSMVGAATVATVGAVTAANVESFDFTLVIAADILALVKPFDFVFTAAAAVASGMVVVYSTEIVRRVAIATEMLFELNGEIHAFAIASYMAISVA